MIADVPTFDLWLEFEYTEPPLGDDPTDDLANVQVRLFDGRKYALNVWTFKFLHRDRFPWRYADTTGRPAEYVVAPNLFVERRDRLTLERVVRQLLASGEMKTEWLCPPDDKTAEQAAPPAPRRRVNFIRVQPLTPPPPQVSGNVWPRVGAVARSGLTRNDD